MDMSTSNDYDRTMHSDGVAIHIQRNRFEISVLPTSEVWEAQAVRLLRDWIKWRSGDSGPLHEAGGVSGDQLSILPVE
jgi:hypothetical protein